MIDSMFSNSNPLVSIITVSLNAAFTIEQTINSVLLQTYPNIEYIIIDGGSSDETVDVIRRYKSRLSYSVSEPDNGIYDAMNKGIQKCHGEIIGIVNADDWIEYDAVSNVVNAFLENDETDIVHGNINCVEDNGLSYLVKPQLHENNIWQSMSILHPATFVRKRVYDYLGGFISDYKIAGDYEFFLRCVINNLRLVYIDKLISNFRVSGVSNRNRVDLLKETKDILFRYKEYIEDFEYEIHILNEKIKGALFTQAMLDNPKNIMGPLKSMMKDQDRIIIWGAGIWGTRCLDFFIQNNIRIICIVEKDAHRRQELALQYSTCSPEEIDRFDGSIIVCIRGANKEEFHNYTSNRKLIFLDEWIDMYYMREK